MKRFALQSLGSIGVVIVGYFVLTWMFPDLDQDTLKRWGVRLPHAIFLPAYAVLPLLGFPISPFLLASGLKYRFWWSLLIATVCMGVHTAAAYYLANGRPGRWLQHLVSRTSHASPKIPEEHQTWFMAMYVAVPGIPYFLKLYLLANTNIPFRRYLLVTWLVHVVTAIPYIGVGTAFAGLNTTMLFVFCGLAVVLMGASHWLKNWVAED